MGWCAYDIVAVLWCSCGDCDGSDLTSTSSSCTQEERRARHCWWHKHESKGACRHERKLKRMSASVAMIVCGCGSSFVW